MHKNSRLLFNRYAKQYFTPELRVLEVGPDREPSTYRALIGHSTASWETVDAFPRTDISLTHLAVSEYEFPIADHTYDIVFSAQVIEHVRKIWRWMPELARVCKPGGVVITINPVSWHYHESPVDCWRIYPEGMRALCDDAGLEVLVSEWGNVEMQSLERNSPRLIKKQQVFQRLSGVLGMLNAAVRFPVEGAFDTITVARKPAVG